MLCMGHGHGTMERIGGRRVWVDHVSATLRIVRVPDLFLPDPWNYGIAWRFSRVARAIIAREQPDIIIVNKVLFWSSISLLCLRAAGHRVLLLTDALVGMTWWPKGRIARLCALLYAWTLGWAILRAAHRVIFFHPQPPALLRRLGIEQHSDVIPTGIDTRAFIPPTTRNAPLTVTYVGRIESIKGVNDYVAGALRARKDVPDLRIRVVGMVRPEHPLVRAHGHDVEFTGLRRDITTILQTTDIFVLPSYAEGLSNALMEAMSSGCACIASDVGGNRFLIENGISGFLFPAGDVEALAAHIRRLAQDPAKRQRMQEHARQRMVALFDDENVGQCYDRLFASWQASATHSA